MPLQDVEDLLQDMCEIVWRKKEWFEQKDIVAQRKIINICLKNKRIDNLRKLKTERRTFDKYNPYPQFQKPQVYSMMELDEVKKKIEDNNLQFMLERAIGFSDDELKTKYGKNIIVKIFNGRNFLNGLTSKPYQRYSKKKKAITKPTYTYVKKALRVACFLLLPLLSFSQYVYVGSTQTISVPLVSGATSYSWTLPPGWTGTSTTNKIICVVGSSGTISVTANNKCGISPPQTFYIMAMVPTINTVCGCRIAVTIQQRLNDLLAVRSGTGTGCTNYTYQWFKNSSDIVIGKQQTLYKTFYTIGDSLTVKVTVPTNKNCYYYAGIKIK